MLEQFGMGTVLFWDPQMIFYILAVEVLVLCILQMRTNRLICKSMKVRTQKKERLKQLKEEVKNGESDIPVVKFETAKGNASPEGKESEPKKPEGKKTETACGFDPKEVAVLREMLAEYFG